MPFAIIQSNILPFGKAWLGFLFDYKLPSVLDIHSRLEVILIHLSAVKVVDLGVR